MGRRFEDRRAANSVHRSEVLGGFFYSVALIAPSYYERSVANAHAQRRSHRVAALDLELKLFERLFALRGAAARGAAGDVLLAAPKLAGEEAAQRRVALRDGEETKQIEAN